MLPFGAASSLGVVISGRVGSKTNIPAIYCLMFGAVLQIVGFALLSTLKGTTSIEPATYGYMVVAGMGCGFCFSTALLVVPVIADKRDQGELQIPYSSELARKILMHIAAVAMGVGNQFRIMGGAFGLAVATSVFNGYVGSQFARLGISVPITDLGAVAGLSLQPAVDDELRRVLSEGYNYQMVVLSAFGAAQLPAALLMWQRKQITTS